MVAYNKYKNTKTTIDNVTFDSKKEANRYCELKLLERAKVIENLRLQVPFILLEKSIYGRAIKYVADFVYQENGIEIVEDCKGFKTDIYKIKKRMLADKYGIVIRET